MSANLDELVQLAKDLAVVQGDVDRLRDQAEEALQPAIEEWFEDPSCGYGAGWSFDHLDSGGEYVVLVHKCQRAHGGLDVEYRTRVSLPDLLASQPEPEPVNKSEMVVVTSNAVEAMRAALEGWDRYGDLDSACDVATAARTLYEQVTS